MGSQASSGNRNASEMQQEDEFHVGGGNASFQKPTRSQLYGESFYCPVIFGSGSKEHFDHGPFPDSTISVANEEEKKADSLNEKIDDLNPDEVDETKTTSEDINGCINCPSDQEIDIQVDEAIAKSVDQELQLASKSVLDYFRLTPIQIEATNVQENQSVEKMDMSTNTSQPSYVDTAAGNSQPQTEMIDCATGMSQELKPDVMMVDCGIQTSQELNLSYEPFAGRNETRLSGRNQADPSRASTSTQMPIVLPRTSCQTMPPEIPAKIPRLNDLDQNCIMSPIYSTENTFDFGEDESNKENDNTILRQRGNVGRFMRKSPSQDEIFRKPSDLENVFHRGRTPSIPLSNLLVSSRGPFLRVGLSKKSRVRVPLHPRQRMPGSEAENQN